MSETYDYGDYNRGGMLAFLFAMVVTLLFFVYVAFLHTGVDLEEIKTKDVEQKMATPDKAAASEDSETTAQEGAALEEEGGDSEEKEESSDEDAAGAAATEESEDQEGSDKEESSKEEDQSETKEDAEQ